MKISGGFRSAQGARDFATLRSVLSTVRKQGLNRIEVLLEGPAALLANGIPAILLIRSRACRVRE